MSICIENGHTRVLALLKNEGEKMSESDADFLDDGDDDDDDFDEDACDGDCEHCDIEGCEIRDEEDDPDIDMENEEGSWEDEG